MPVAPALVWFRQDLRLQDNPALNAAVARGGPVVPVFIWDDQSAGRWSAGAATRWWLHHSLVALDESLRARGSHLVILKGDPAEEIEALVRASEAEAVYWNRRYDAASAMTDGGIESALRERGVDVQTFNASLLHEPDSVANKQGGPFQVFTPFWRHCLTLPVDLPGRLAIKMLRAPKTWPQSCAIAKLKLLPSISWDAQFYSVWEPGEAGAAKRLRHFVARGLRDYDARRNWMAEDGTSRLSPHLHFGEISPRQVWAAVRRAGRASGVFPPNRGASVFLNEIGWREFAHHLVFHFPHTPELPLREEFEHFPWAADEGGGMLHAWRRGRTGYPIVDAAMRELWATGWMHNRARMIVASFLVKHLRLPWQAGAEWFWDTLVDADLANNTLGWQWSAGCGADAAPYFRIFAPVLQGQKFYPEGEYVRRWVPELARLSTKYIHAPWTAPVEELEKAGVTLEKTYPRPIVDHGTARKEALAAFKQLRAARR